MALNAYLKLKGQKQGDIPGSVTTKGREGSILVHSFDNEAAVPHDPGTGQPSGKRQHEPIVILKEIDKSSPLLWNALATNETLTTWELQVCAPATTPGGDETVIYTVSLKNAHIVSIHGGMQSGAMMMANATDPTAPSTQEDVSFTYDQVTWTWTDGGVTATDNW